jgi:hypothetical protein
MNGLLFSPIRIGELTLKNRLTMAPFYLGHAGEGGTVSDLCWNTALVIKGRRAFCVRWPPAKRQVLKAMFV